MVILAVLLLEKQHRNGKLRAIKQNEAAEREE
jgi:hypothetical protein